MNMTVREHYTGKLLPSKLSEMIAEIELEGYTIKQKELGWNVEMFGTYLLDRSAATKEECVVTAHSRIFRAA